MRKLLILAAAALFSTAAVPASAHGYDSYRYYFYHQRDHAEHGDFHRDFNEAHDDAHDDGFANRRDHNDWHDAYNRTHERFHEDHPRTWHDHSGEY